MQGSDVEAPPTQKRRPPPGRKLYPVKWVAMALAVTAALLIGGPYLVIHLLLGSTPSKLQLPAVVAHGPLAPGPVSGGWTVSTGSQAGYRVDELLFGQTHTAVGRTTQVAGGLVISGSQVTQASFSVDMASVKSDQGARDAQFRGFIMDTADHPHGTFHLTEPIQLGQIPATGQAITVQATGELTLRDVTRQVTFGLRAERVSGGIDVNAEILVTFSLWKIPDPSFAVARLGHTGTIEVLLDLVPADASGRPLHPVAPASSTTTTFVPGTF